MSLIKQSLTFRGLSTRKQFWLTQLVILGVLFIGEVIGGLTQPLLAAAHGTTFASAIAFFLVIPSSIIIFKRRLNDAGWSGWWMLVPGLNWIVAGFFGTKIVNNKHAL